MEPARKHRPEIEPELRPKLGAIEGGGESSDDRGDLTEASQSSGQLANAEKRFGVIQGGGESSDDRTNLQSVRDKEEEGNGLYKPDENKRPRGPMKVNMSTLLRSRKTASGGIIGLLIALLGGISMFVTPGIAAVQLKEIMTDDLNDQLGAMDMRSVYVMRAKLNDLGKGVCTGVKIKCGFKGMSDRQLNKFKTAGFDVKTDGKTTFGRNKVVSLSITNSAGDKITANNPKELNRLIGDRLVRTALRKAFNPKFAGFFDAKWDKFKQRYKLTSHDKLGTGSEEEKKKNIASATQGEPIDATTPDARSTTNEDGSTNTENEQANKSAERSAAAANADGVPTKAFLKSGATGAIKGIGALGAIDVGCTIKNTARAVEAGAKIYRYRQLIAYSMVFLTFADQIKAGTATPDQAEFVGNTLTAVDTDEMIFDETSPLDGEEPQEVKNPYYGANAFDSAGYKTAMYNEAPTLSARDMQMAVGGGMSLSMLGKVNGIIDKLGGNKCKYVQNWAVRGGSLIAGIALGAVTLGAWTAASIGASMAISMALPLLENYLAQMTSGTVADGNTKGVDTGNAIFAGTAALMGGMAMSRGMKPATKSDLKSYLALNDEVKNEYIAIETEEARSTPFDVNNRYSFLGSITRTLLPVRTTSSVSAGNAIFNGLGSILSAPLLVPSAHAESAYNEDRYSKCEDNGYAKLGINADVFCNVRYTLSPEELSLDTDVVREQMLAWGQVNDDEEGSVVTDSDYEKWLAECTEREEGWGETPDPEKPDDGDGMRCMNNDMKDHYYRVYTMDASVIAAMDYIPPTGTNVSPAGAETFTVGTYNMCQEINHPDCPNQKTKIEKITGVIEGTTGLNSTPMDIIGAQELSQPTQKQVISALSGYESYPKEVPSSNGKAIIWNTAKFTKTGGDSEAGLLTGVNGNGDSDSIDNNSFPWVHLTSTNGQSVYVMSIHSPNDSFGNAADRYENVQKILEWQKQKSSDGSLVIVTGDFNNGAKVDGGNPGAYCYLTSDSQMQHAADMAQSKPTGTACPSERVPIDQIYSSVNLNGLTAKGWHHVSGSDSGSIAATDHSPAYVTYNTPGTADEGGDIGGSVAGDDFGAACAAGNALGAPCDGQCVSFVKYRLLKHKTKYTGGSLGNGKDVVGTLAGLGYETGSVAKVNSVFSTSQTSQPEYGHTGIVSEVRADGSIVIEEYNFDNPKHYGTRTMSKAEYEAKGYTFAYIGSILQ